MISLIDNLPPEDNCEMVTDLGQEARECLRTHRPDFVVVRMLTSAARLQTEASSTARARRVGKTHGSRVQ